MRASPSATLVLDVEPRQNPTHQGDPSLVSTATHKRISLPLSLFTNAVHRLRAVSSLTDSSHLFNKAGLTVPFSFTCSDYLNASVALVALIRAANLILVIVHTLPRHSFSHMTLPPLTDLSLCMLID